MGNGWTPSTAKVDFVPELPPELLAVVFSYLTILDLFNCLLVCKQWRSSILHLRPYWTKLLLGLGVSLRSVSYGLETLSSYKDLYLAVREYCSRAEALNLVSSVPVCYPCSPWLASKVHCVSKLSVVLWMERVEEVSYLRVEELVSSGEVVYARSLGSVVLGDGLSVKWAHYSSNGCVYWVDGSGLCGGYDVERDKQLRSVDLSLPRNTPLAGLRHGQVETKFEGDEGEEVGEKREEGDEVGEKREREMTTELVAGCEECSTIVVWRLELEHSTANINLQVVRKRVYNH